MYLPTSWNSPVNRMSKGIACRLSKLPPVNPVCELLTLSTVRLAVAIIQTWPGLRGLGLGSNSALPSRSDALERACLHVLAEER